MGIHISISYLSNEAECDHIHSQIWKIIKFTDCTFVNVNSTAEINF